MVMQLTAMFYLWILSAWDAKKRELPLWLLGLGSIPAVLSAYAEWMGKGRTCEEILFGLVPGGLLLCLAGLNKGAGAGDGIVLLQVNFFFFLEQTILAFVFSMVLISLFSAGLLLTKKGSKEMRLPYLPFLWLGCFGTMFI